MKKKLEKKINLVLSLVVILVLLPLLATILLQQMRLEDLIQKADAIETTEDVEQEEIEWKVLKIVAREIRADSSTEAILAQTVIARTNLYAAQKNHTAEPTMYEIDEMQELWQDNFEEIYGILEEHVAQTKGQVLVWNKDYIYAAFHAISAGETRTMTEVYEESNMPYLKQVSCGKDTNAEGYIAVQYFSKDEMGDVTVLSRDGAGYVLQVQQGEQIFTGEEFREKYQLQSACFSITQVENQVRVVTKGLGHGFGLSQYTAEQMAREGKSYEEILNFFYNEAKIVAVDSINHPK